ncbi:Terpene synthase [Abortiporus biennis]
MLDPSRLKAFPAYFILPDLTEIVAPLCEFKSNPNEQQATENLSGWFGSFGPCRNERERRLSLSHSFERFGSLTFPLADCEHLETCIKFLMWSFAFDDISDEGELQAEPESIKVGVDLCAKVLDTPLSAPLPTYKYAAMLHDIWSRVCSNASPSACRRFVLSTKVWIYSQVEQAGNRSESTVPHVKDFVDLRRRTFGGMTAEAMAMYTMHSDIPDYVWCEPVMTEISNATQDLMIWPNDLCSFNKEQADGDYHNLVMAVMLEHDLDLQTAINFVSSMLAKRVKEYMELKKQIPSFGPKVDEEIARYLTAIEHCIQGATRWYYGKRYFRDLDITNRNFLVVPVFKSSRPKPVSPSQTAPQATFSAEKQTSHGGLLSLVSVTLSVIFISFAFFVSFDSSSNPHFLRTGL